MGGTIDNKPQQSVEALGRKIMAQDAITRLARLGAWPELKGIANHLNDVRGICVTER